MARPGFVLEVDERTPPLLIHQGEGFRLEKFPLGSRAIYPPDALPKLRDVRGAIRQALADPLGSEPLTELLEPGMKLTIAIDDISLPLPPMQAPDIRQLVLEEVIELAARNGVEDIKLYMANSLHRRMTGPEIKRAVGERVYRSLPQGPKEPRRRGSRQPAVRRHDRPGRGGRAQQARGRVRPARLREHQPGGPRRRPQVRGDRPRELPERAASPQRAHAPALELVHGPARGHSAIHDSLRRMGR